MSRETLTIEQLRSKKKELMARKRYELEQQMAGHGDSVAIFEINEELNDVKAALRALAPGHSVGRASVPERSQYGVIRQQFQNWDRENNSHDEEIEEGRALMRRAVVESLEELPECQRKYLLMFQSGLNYAQIAKECGVNKSTVSRCISAAKKKCRLKTEIAVQAKRAKESGVIDMADPVTARAALMAMTATQVVYLYLYFGEWLSTPQIASLIGRDRSTVSRCIHRALDNVSSILGYQQATLVNMGFLDELAYGMYVEIQDHGLREAVDDEFRELPKAVVYHPPTPPKPEGVPEVSRRTVTRLCHPRGTGPKTADAPFIPALTFRCSTGESAQIHSTRMTPKESCSKHGHGKLMSALLERQRRMKMQGHSLLKNQVYHWMVQVFSALSLEICQRKKQGF